MNIFDWLRAYLPPISFSAEPLFIIHTPLGDIPFTNSMLFTLVVIAGLTIFFAYATRRMELIPRGAQNLAEAIVEVLLGMVEGVAGKTVGRRIFPLIATLFLFIITANWAGLLPGVGTVGLCLPHETPAGHEQAHAAVKVASPLRVQEEAGGGALPVFECPNPGEEFVPLLRAPNADLHTTLAMAILAVFIVQLSGVAAHGVRGYLKELTTPLLLAPVHIIGELSRIISLSFRLFGNIFGGEVLVTVMFALLGAIFIGFGTFVFLGLEVLFGFIQALVFSMLTLVYIATAVGGHGAAEAHGEHAESPAERFGRRIADFLTGRQYEQSAAPSPAHTQVPGTEAESGTERHMG
jgi:F-type H+-transporting ATPase subunit a